MATKIGVRREKKEKTPGREFGVGVRGADASRIDAGAGIGSFNPFNQPFNNPNVYDAAVPMIPRSKSNPQLGNYAVPGLDVPSEPVVDPMELALAQAMAGDMRGVAGGGAFAIPSTIQNDLTLPMADGGVANNWAAQSARSYGLRTDDKYRQAVDANRKIGALIQSGAISAAEASDPNSPYYTPPMKVASSGTGMDAKTFRQRIGAKAKENQAARAADPIRQKVQANAIARQSGGVGITGELDGEKLMKHGLETGNERLFKIGAELAAKKTAAKQQEFDNSIATGQLNVSKSVADNQMKKLEQEAAAEAPAKPGSADFNAGMQQKAAPFRGLKGKPLYDQVGPILDTIPNDPAEAANYAAGAGMAPDVLQEYLNYRPEPYIGDPFPGIMQAWNWMFGLRPQQFSDAMRRRRSANQLLEAGQTAR